MRLVPIHVRGKRRTPQTKVPAALERDQQRPPKVSRKSLTTVMATRATRQRPVLDALPAEILEKILLYSMSLSLPHASPVIGARLSARVTLVRFFLWAFHETWDQWFGIPAERILEIGPAPSCDGDYRLQSAVLRQPWATTDLILQAQQTWAEKNGGGRRHEHVSPSSSSDSGRPQPSQDCGPPHSSARRCFEVDYEQALERGHDQPFLWYLDRASGFMAWAGHDVHPRTRIPDELLAGPWTDEEQKRLFWLVRGGTSVRDDPSSWEVRLEFLRNAILDVSDPKLVPINCLMGGGWPFHGLPRDVIRREMAGIDRRLKWGDDTPDSRHLLRTVHHSFSMELGRMPHAGAGV